MGNGGWTGKGSAFADGDKLLVAFGDSQNNTSLIKKNIS
jgi:hypothetical protein